jgi:hypothetical protein
MEIDPADLDFEKNVVNILDETFKVAWVVPEEHAKLNARHMHTLRRSLGRSSANGRCSAMKSATFRYPA